MKIDKNRIICFLFFILVKIIIGNIIPNVSQTIRVFSKIIAGILIIIVKKKNIRIILFNLDFFNANVKRIGKINKLKPHNNI